MASTVIPVAGLKELGAAFALLNADMQGPVARATTNAGAQVVKKLAILKAPVAKEDYVVDGVKVPKGNLAKKIAVKFIGKTSTLTSEHIVFIRAKRKDGYANRIGNLQEFGTVKMPAHPFMRPALAEGKEPAIAAMAARLKQRIDKANKP